MYNSEQYLSEYDDKLVAQWDTLTDWNARSDSEGSFFTGILQRAGAKTVLDAATGTGFHAVELSSAGFRVSAVDGAPEMVEVAARNLRDRGFPDVDCSVGDWRFADSMPEGPFDAIVCLGNSLAHLFTKQELVQTLTTFRHLLRPGGTLIIDQRNYDGILAGQVSGKVRKYCCTGIKSMCELKVLDPATVQITYATQESKPMAIVTHAWRVQEIQSVLRECQFEIAELFGDSGMNFDQATAEFVIHVATKGADNG